MVAVPAADIINGQLLEKLAESHLNIFKEMMPNKALVAPRIITWASLCSGSEGIHFVMEAMQEAYRAAGIQVTLQQQFACEYDEQNQKWILELAGKKENAPCLFASIKQLDGAAAKCLRHKGTCAIGEVDVLVYGFSCKDLSRQNPNRAKSLKDPENILAQGVTPGGSAQTFRQSLKYIDKHPPGMIILENVDGMDDNKDAPEGSDMDLCLAEFSARGYESQAFLMDNNEFGLPASRRRFYIVFLRTTGSTSLSLHGRSISAIFETLKKLVNVCRRQAPCASTVLLPGDDPAVAKWLQCLVSKTSERSLSSPGAWSEHHMREFQSLGRRVGQGVPVHVSKSPWFQTLSRREQSCLEHAITEQPDLFMVDVSQSLKRTRFSFKEQNLHVAPAMMPIQIMWIHASQLKAYGQPCGRLLLGREALLMQGFPINKVMEAIENTSEEHLRRMAGNSFGFPVVLAILMATFAAVDWRESTPSASVLASDDAQVAAAMQAFAVLRGQEGESDSKHSIARRERKIE